MLLVAALLLNVVLINPGTIKAEAPDVFTYIEAGDTREVTISYSGEVEYFCFIPEVSGIYNVYSDENSCDPTVGLLDSNGYWLTGDDDSVGLNFVMAYSFVAGVTYYLEAAAYGTGSYTLHLDYGEADLEPEYSDICEDESVYLADLEGSEYFRFVPESSGYYTIFSSDSTCDPWVVILDEGWYEMTNGDNENGNDFSITWYLVAGDTYYIETGMNGSGSYNLNLVYKDLEVDFTDVYVGDSKAVTIDSSYEFEYFRFIPEASGTYTFYSSDYTGDPKAYLRDRAGNELAYSDDTAIDSNFSITYDFVVGRIYYLQAGMWSDRTGSYTLHLVAGNQPEDPVEPDDPWEPVSFTDIYVGDSKNVTIEETYGEVYFRFIPETSGTYTFYSSDRSCDPYATLLDEYRGQLVYSDDYNGLDFSITYYLEAGEIYYLQADAYGSGTYTLNLVYGEHEDEEPVYPDIQDIHAGDGVYLGYLDEAAYFRFIPDASGYYTFYSCDNTCDPWAVLFDDTWGEIEYSDNVNEYNFSITYYMEAGVTYYFAAGMYTSGYCTVNLVYGEPEVEEPEYTDIYVGDSHYVSIDTEYESEYYRFIPEVSSSYTFYSSDCTGDPKGYLLNAYGTELSWSDDYDGRNYSITYDFVAGEIYYLKAAMYGSYTGYYTLHLVAEDGSVEIPDEDPIEILEGAYTYNLFNSGMEYSYGYGYSDEWDINSNLNDHTYNNGGYDLFGGTYIGGFTFGMGLPFYISAEVTERATLTVYAFDVDEESNETDEVYLVNATTGARTHVGNLSGMDSTWSTTTITINPSCFEVGNTYYFEANIAVDGWETWIRRVSLEMTCGEYVPTTIVDHRFSASVATDGYVFTNLYLVTDQNATYNLEYTANINGWQMGGMENTSITAGPSGATATCGFYLENGSPAGVYEISVILKDALGNTVATYTTTAGHYYSAVSYDPNGGSNNLPTDTNGYSSGDTVTVLFDYIPSRAGYTFLGWATSASATQPEFTANGNKTFIIGDEDVTLYAVWQQNQVDNPDYEPGDADQWEGTIASGFGGGNGTESNPYLIYTAEQLAYLAYSTNNGNSYENVYFKLMNDLDLNGLEWTPIGKGVMTYEVELEGPYFAGAFDGNYHVVYNLLISNGSTSYNGLFGDVYWGSIENLGIVNAYVFGCSDQGKRMNNGALAGRVQTASVMNCFAKNAEIYAYTYDDPANAGLLLGNVRASATITDCYAQGSATTNASAGGLMGAIYSAYQVIVTNCYAWADVTYQLVVDTNAADEIGGLCGFTGGDGVVFSNCFFTGSISGDYAGKYTIANEHADIFLNNCYFHTLSDATTQGTYVSSYSLQEQSWIVENLNWNFSSVWTFVAGETYPVLQGYVLGGGGDGHIHTPGEWIVDREPTCTTSGSKHTECTECGRQLENIYIPALNHNYQSVVTREATCTEPGVVTHTCTRCSDSYMTYIYSQHSYSVTARQEATCTADGYITYTCSNCGDSYNEIIEGGHSYIAEITLVATPTSDGAVTYTCEICGDSYVEVIPARPDAKILLIQDRLPWSENNNVSLLNKMQADGYITGWDMTTTSNFNAADLVGYGVVLIANDQTTATYNQLRDIQDALVSFANAGGVVIYGACDEGWAAGTITYTLPEGAEKTNYYSNYNYIVDPSNPVVTGIYTDGKALTNTLLYGTYCSHTSFSNLPAGSNVILQDGRGNPTLVEYPVGNGHVILSGLTWEFYYTRNVYNALTDDTFTKNVYDDLILYALQLSDPCDHAYDAGVVVEPTCTQQGYILHTCSLCGGTMKDNFVDAYGHAPSEWVIVEPATTTQAGLMIVYCEVCGETLDQEIIPMLNTPVISVVVDAETVILGQTFDAYVVIDDMDPVKSVAFVPVYDTDLFELVSVQWLKQATIQTINPEIISAWNIATDINGDLLKLTFRAKGLTSGSRITSDAYVQNDNGLVQVSVVGDSIAVVECPHEEWRTSSMGELGHLEVCSFCGLNVLVEHTFDHGCDNLCDDCGYERETSHVADGQLYVDDFTHWEICVHCGEIMNTHRHEFEDTNDCVCETCGYIRPIRGDVDADGDVDSDDAIQLLMHFHFPENYHLNQSGDMDGNGVVDSDDSIYLLMYTYFQEEYPLYDPYVK